VVRTMRCPLSAGSTPPELPVQGHPSGVHGILGPENLDTGSPELHLGAADVQVRHGPHVALGGGQSEVRLGPGTLLLRQPEGLLLSEHLQVGGAHRLLQARRAAPDSGVGGPPPRLGLTGAEEGGPIDGVRHPQVVGGEVVRRLVTEAQLLRGEASETLLSGSLPGHGGAGADRRSPREARWEGLLARAISWASSRLSVEGTAWPWPSAGRVARASASRRRHAPGVIEVFRWPCVTAAFGWKE